MQEIEKNWKKIERNGLSRTLNTHSQPVHEFAIFNNPKVLTESWYPVIASKKVKRKMTHSFVIGNQRVVIYRTESGKLNAMDAFCPHMGADLGNGKVVGNKIQCYFHQWEFHENGQIAKIPCRERKPSIKIQTYPIEEKYGYIWIYSGAHAAFPIPNPPGLEEDEVSGFFLLNPRLFVHHHVMMVSAIDLQHFKTVHKLDVNFQFEIENKSPSEFQWNVFGELPRKGWRSRLARIILGNHFEYSTLFSGGNIVSINYGNSPRWRGRPQGFRLPSVHILWGCVPLKEGVSDVYVFLVQRKAKTVFAKIKNAFNFFISVLLLNLLRDDDVKAFPHMRFAPTNLIEQDRSSAMLIQQLNKVKKSSWSFEN
jgi:phenylpropionate dioxygenase-like ring-hydroxylating dioxygenase large terminal subunit